jgi:hypothetical protein
MLSRLEAMSDLTRLENTLENMDIAYFLLTPQDIEQQGHEMLLFAHMLKNNTRNFYTLVGNCRKGLEFELEMAAVWINRDDSLARKFSVKPDLIISDLQDVLTI